MTRSRSLLALAVMVALSGCGGDNGSGGGAKGKDPNGRATSGAPTPLERRDAPPAGVAEQVSYFAAGNGGCPEGDGPTVRFLGGYPREGQEWIGQNFVICVSGFERKRAVTVNVRRPDGRNLKRRITFDRRYGLHQLPWLPLPGDPLGRHDVTARQGTTTAKASFSVRRAPFPWVRSLDAFVPPGRPVRIVLAGFPSGQSVRLHLYRKSASGRFSYLTSITSRVDRRGEALYQLSTAPATPRDDYLVRWNKDAQDTFTVGDPPPELR